MPIHFSTGNNKLRKTTKLEGKRIAAFDLPAGSTCPFAGDCKRYCYASCGNYKFSRKVQLNETNLMETQCLHFRHAVHGIFSQLLTKKKLYNVVRIHSSGDFYSREYLDKWIEIARDWPEVEFYAYTKSHPLTYLKELPKNLTLIPSSGGTKDRLLEGKPHAKVVPAEGYELKEGEIFGDEDNDLWNLRKFKEGYVICLKAHGQKKGKV